MVLSLVQVVEGFRGVEVVEGYLVAGLVSVVGGKIDDYFNCKRERGDWKDHHRC